MRRGIVFGMLWGLVLVGPALGLEVAEKVEFPDAAGTAVDPITDNGIWLKDVAGTLTLWKTDEAGDAQVGSAGVTDHGALTGLADDDHGAGGNAYHTAARHSTSHDTAALNNAGAISGDTNGSVTAGAHWADDEVHYVRPVQTLTVAKDGSGQYATIAAALAVANGAASGANQYEIALSPGVWVESNLPVDDNVSIRSVIPWQAVIQDTSANPILIVEATSVLDGLLITNLGAGSCIELTAASSGEVKLIRVGATSTTGSVIDFNGTSQNVTIESGSRLLSSGAPLISGKTQPARLIVRNSTLDFSGANAIGAIIDIDDGGASPGTSDIFDSCFFFADNLLAGVTPSSFIDWDAGFLDLRNCVFVSAVNTGKTFSNIFAQAGTVSVQSCRFAWVLTDGTEYDFNAAGGAAINHASTVYDVGRPVGAGTIAFMREGSAGFEALDVLGPVLVAGDDDPLMRLVPDGDGTTLVIEPAGPLAAGETWQGIVLDGGASDPTGAGASVGPFEIDLSGTAQGNNPNIRGALIKLPGTFTSSGEIYGLRIEGDSNTVTFMNQTSVFEIISSSVIPLILTFLDSVADSVECVLQVKRQSTLEAGNGLGGCIEFVNEDATSGPQTIAKIVAVRSQGLDNNGDLRFQAGPDGNDVMLDLQGGLENADFPMALGPGSAVQIGSGPEIYNDGGLVVDDSGQDSRWIADSLTVSGSLIATSPNFPVGLFERTSAETNTDKPAVSIKHTTSANMVEGFGSGLVLAGEDSASGNVIFAKVLGVRGTTDFDGKIVLQCGFLGDEDALTIDQNLAGTMPGKLTVGSAVAAEILVVSDGTNRVARGYDGAPHDKVFGDSQFQYLAGDTDSDMALVAKGDGTGLGRLRSITSDGTKFVQMYHDGTRGEIDSNFGPIGMNDDVEFDGGVLYNDTFFEDLGVSLTASQPGPSSTPDLVQFMDDGAGSTGVFAYEFDPTTEEYLFFISEMPHQWSEGSDIGIHIHWSPNGTGAANEFVVWGLEYTWQSIDGIYGNTAIATSDASAAGTATTSGDGTMLDAKHYQTLIATIAGAGNTISSVLVCRIFRDAGDGDDDYPNGAYGLHVDFHFEVDAPGSVAGDHTKF